MRQDACKHGFSCIKPQKALHVHNTTKCPTNSKINKGRERKRQKKSPGKLPGLLNNLEIK